MEYIHISLPPFMPRMKNHFTFLAFLVVAMQECCFVATHQQPV
jgi:hypothetical protein